MNPFLNFLDNFLTRKLVCKLLKELEILYFEVVLLLEVEKFELVRERLLSKYQTKFIQQISTAVVQEQEYVINRHILQKHSLRVDDHVFICF